MLNADPKLGQMRRNCDMKGIWQDSSAKSLCGSQPRVVTPIGISQMLNLEIGSLVFTALLLHQVKWMWIVKMKFKLKQSFSDCDGKNIMGKPEAENIICGDYSQHRIFIGKMSSLEFPRRIDHTVYDQMQDSFLQGKWRLGALQHIVSFKWKETITPIAYLGLWLGTGETEWLEVWNNLAIYCSCHCTNVGVKSSKIDVQLLLKAGSLGYCPKLPILSVRTHLELH